MVSARGYPTSHFLVVFQFVLRFFILDSIPVDDRGRSQHYFLIVRLPYIFMQFTPNLPFYTQASDSEFMFVLRRAA